MPVAVQLYLDPVADEHFHDLWEVMESKDLGTWIHNIGTRPHLSLAVFDDDVSKEPLMAATKAFAESLRPFSVKLAGIGTFAGETNVVYICPAPTAELLARHAEYHLALERVGLQPNPFYLPGSWVPHCTVAARLDLPTMATTIELWRSRFPFSEVEFVGMGIVQVPPVQELAEWVLAPTAAEG